MAKTETAIQYINEAEVQGTLAKDIFTKDCSNGTTLYMGTVIVDTGEEYEGKPIKDRVGFKGFIKKDKAVSKLKEGAAINIQGKNKTFRKQDGNFEQMIEALKITAL